MAEETRNRRIVEVRHLTGMAPDDLDVVEVRFYQNSGGRLTDVGSGPVIRVDRID
jgi:hypothetical protein